MKTPRLNRQLVLETKDQVPDGAGGFLHSWRILGALWAEVISRSGGDRAGEAGPLAATGFRITVRGAPVGSSMRPQPGQRFREGTRVYRIDAVGEKDPEARFLLCFAEEEVAA